MTKLCSSWSYFPLCAYLVSSVFRPQGGAVSYGATNNGLFCFIAILQCSSTFSIVFRGNLIKFYGVQYLASCFYIFTLKNAFLPLIVDLLCKLPLYYFVVDF